MKKRFLALIILTIAILLSACHRGPKDYRANAKTDVPDVLLAELEAGCAFFWDTANSDRASAGYGLIPDRYDTVTGRPGNIASIASVGFGLSALPIMVECGWKTQEEAEERAYYTLETLANMERTNGFWYHFVDMKMARRAWECEVSVIDSAILISGVLVAGEYFGGRVEKLATQLYRTINWTWYYDFTVNKFYMGYTPEKGFSGHWNGYAEHLMMFVLGAGSPDYPVPVAGYRVMKMTGKLVSATPQYGRFYAAHTGSLFTYQYSHAWIDFARYRDADGFDWFENSVNAVKAAVYFAQTETEYETLNENSWGLSACDGPDGYVGPYGSPPSAGNAHIVDGTVPAYGALGSVVFWPERAIAAANHYRSFPEFWSDYGFKDAYNLDHGTDGWFATDIIGIDKGISVLMIENYISGMIWELYHENKYVNAGLKKLGFTEVRS